MWITDYNKYPFKSFHLNTHSHSIMDEYRDVYFKELTQIN